MKKWVKHLDISRGLQLSFIISAMLCLLVGMSGLYIWQLQRHEINTALDKNYPKLQAAFQMEEQINLLHHIFVQHHHIKTTNEKIDWYSKAKLRLNTIKELVIELDENLDDDLMNLLNSQSELLEHISNNLSAQLQLNEEFNQMTAKITWLHNDFHYEFTALLQEISWQQSTLANKSAIQPTENTQKITQLKRLQQELILVRDFVNYEEQIITALQKHSQQAHPNTLLQLNRHLKYLSLLIQQRSEQLKNHSSILTIQQILNELINIGSDPHKLPALIEKKQTLNQEIQQLTLTEENLFKEIRDKIYEQVGNNQKQLAMLHHIVENSSKVQSMIILISMLFTCILVIVVNFGYIRFRLLKRFELLNSAVEQLNKGNHKVKIAIYGNDELGRIAKLLRAFLFEMNKKQQELEKRNDKLLAEIQHRKTIQKTLEATQHELIQTAKLAVVGKTLTSINHEITQPLNAMNAYLFSAKRALSKQDISLTQHYLEKIEHLVERTAQIIKRLRHFSKQGSGQLQPISLKNCIENAWELLETKHKPRTAQLVMPTIFPQVWGETVLIEQVFVNLFLNALEATERCSSVPPLIRLEFQPAKENKICLWISDNGEGWPLEKKLLQPFSSSKSVNLGLGLSISQSIMQQCQGELYIASTITGHALIILEFKEVKHVE